VHLKHGYCMLIHFIHGYYGIYRPWRPLTYLYFPYCISLIYFSFTKIRMFLYAQIYWLAEFGDVSCLQFNYLRVETHSDLGGFCRTILRLKYIRYIEIFFKKNQKFVICNMYDWKYFVILLYNLHFAFYIIYLLKFRSLFKLV
jgi:hypothetical protein